MTLKMTNSKCCRPVKKTCDKGKKCEDKKGNPLFTVSLFLRGSFLISGIKLCNKRKKGKKRKNKKGLKTCTHLKNFFKKKIAKKKKLTKKKKLAKKKKSIAVIRKASTKTNTKCKTKGPKTYRMLVLGPGGGIYRNKEPIPDKRIYKERTLEFGIVMDKFLFHEMKVEIS